MEDYSPNIKYQPGLIRVSPFVDIDISSIIWVGGVPTQIETTGLGKTKTEILTWVDNELQSIATVIT